MKDVLRCEWIMKQAQKALKIIDERSPEEAVEWVERQDHWSRGTKDAVLDMVEVVTRPNHVPE